MGLFRRSTVNADSEISRGSATLQSVVLETVKLGPFAATPSALVAITVLWPHILKWGVDVRLFLILSDAVDEQGASADWQFHALYPTLQAEAVWRLQRSPDEDGWIAAYCLKPVPEPGSSEHLLAQVSIQMALDQKVAWQARLAMIESLPTVFTDSVDAVAGFRLADVRLFDSGPIRMKARRLPSGATVWEVHSFDVLHLPFGSPSD